MEKTFLVRLAFVFLAASTLSGCILAIEDDGYRRGNLHERDRGDRHGENHGDHRQP